MNKIKVILTASLLSLFSFGWTSTASSAEFAAGVGMMTGAWMGKGKEVIGSADGDTTEEDLDRGGRTEAAELAEQAEDSGVDVEGKTPEEVEEEMAD